MAQRRIFNFEEDDKTDLLNRQHIAPIPAGRYRGFDYDAVASTGHTLVLKHTSTGYSEVDSSLAILNNQGLIRTQQGVNIVENAPVSITVADNVINGYPRIDLIVAEHEYVAVTGGVDAAYVQIIGTASSTPAIPALTVPSKQVIIGYLYWPASGTDLDFAGVTYTPASSPKFNGEIAHFLSQFMEDATIASGVLSSAISANAYKVANVISSYIEIDTLDFPFSHSTNQSNEINVLHLYTLQRLKFVSSGNISVGSPVHIEAGSVVTLIDLRNTSIGGGTSSFIVMRGNEVNRDKITKLFSQLVFNGGTASISLMNGGVTLDNKGNYYELSYDFNSIDIAGIVSTLSLADSAIAPSTSGGLIFLKLINTGAALPNGGNLSNGGATTGFKSFSTQLGTDIPIFDGDTLILLETDTAYNILLQTGSKVNLTKLYNDYHALTQTEEKVYTKAVSTGWKSLGSGNFNTTTGVLTITDEGNSFICTVPTGDLGGILKDVKISRNGAGAVDCPNGMIINLKFIQASYLLGVSESFMINVGASSNILCSVDDAIRFAGGASGFYHLGVPTNLEVFTLRKSNTKWDIIAISPDAGVYTRLKTLEALQVLEAWRVIGATGQPTFVSGYTPFAGSPPRFRKNGLGMVTLAGMVVVPSTFVSSAVVTTLPVGYRPAYDMQKLAADNASLSPVDLFISSNGDIRFYSTVNIASRMVYLDDTHFYNT